MYYKLYKLITNSYPERFLAFARNDTFIKIRGQEWLVADVQEIRLDQPTTSYSCLTFLFFVSVIPSESEESLI
jgi:hypothetical protein